jgi:3-deoxy-D-manno-octulosonate 8-phosphate phosphatase (KDO 8-P phosphatase)
VSLNLIDNIDAFIFDFDGVLTNNLVYVDADGHEFVSCSRSDGLAFDVLRKLKKPSFIISTESNSVVKARAKKLKIPVFQGVKNKVNILNNLVNSHGYSFDKIAYIGNDLNDFQVMKLCGLRICPSDSHNEIKKIANVVLKTKGGHGVVREILEENFKLNFLKILY